MTTLNGEVREEAQARMQSLANAIFTLEREYKPLEKLAEKPRAELRQSLVLLIDESQSADRDERGMPYVYDSETQVIAKLGQRGGVVSDFVDAVARGFTAEIIEAAAAGLLAVDVGLYRQLAKGGQHAWLHTLVEHGIIREVEGQSYVLTVSKQEEK